MYDKLKKNYEFSNVFKYGKRVVGREISLHYRRNNFNQNRLGVTTVKHYGNAVERNRKRRLIREAYRSLAPQVKSSYDIIIMGRISHTESTLFTVRDELEHLLRKANLLTDNPQ